MKIAEMEEHHDRYTTLDKNISELLRDRNFHAVFSACQESFPHIVPAIQFRKKRGIKPEMPRLLSFSTICKYGPPLFEHPLMESLLEFVKSTRLLAKHDNGYAQSVEAALDQEEVARVLWNLLEQQPGILQRSIRQTVGCSQDIAVAILEIWQALGVITRKQEQNSYRIYLCSSLDATVKGMCPACGALVNGRKHLFFKPASCPQCGNEGYCHIIASDH